MKTDRRDSESLARLHRAGELTAVWVPGPEQEAVRDLTRAREDTKALERQAKHRSSGRRSGGVLLFLFTCPIAPFGFGVARGRDMTRLAELGKQ